MQRSFPFCPDMRRSLANEDDFNVAITNFYVKVLGGLSGGAPLS